MSDQNTQKFGAILSTPTTEFVSHRSFIIDQRNEYFEKNPFQILDYTEEYLRHLQEKNQKLREQREREANNAPQRIQKPQEVPAPEQMTDLMDLVNDDVHDEESDDILADIKKDFVSPYEQEAASTVMMPASELLEQAEREAQEDAELEKFEFTPVQTQQAHQLYARLEQVFLDVMKEWKEYSEDYDNQEATQRFTYAVIKKIDSVNAQIKKLPEKNESFIRNWIQGTLFKLVDEFFIMFSKVYASAYSGNMAAARVRNWLQEILFGRLNDLFIQLQWFSIDMLLPLQSEFDPREHIMSKKQDAGPEFRNYVVGIERAGIYTFDGSTRVRKPIVIMGS